MTHCIPARYSLAILLMGVVVHLFTLRSNFSIIVVSMVKHPPQNIGNSSGGIECYVNTSYGKYSEVDQYMAAMLYNETSVVWKENSTEHKSQDTFSWDPITQGRIIGAYAYGHVFSQVMGGFLEARFGGKKVLGLSILLSSVLTLLTPAAAFAGEWWLFAVRVVVGFVQGVVFPSLFGILSRWAPSVERGRLLTIATLGETLGILVGFSITAHLITQFGWAIALYITGAVGLAFCCLWCLLAFDSPAKHPRISETEKAYIESNLENTNEERNIPWLKMLSTPHLWVLVYIHCTDSWGLDIMMTSLPLYIDTIMNFNIDTNGGVSALPYLTIMASRVLSSLIIDPVINQSRFQKVNIRKVCILVLVGAAACLVAVGHVGCDSTTAIVLLCLGMAFRGVMVPGFYPSYTDLTLGYSGVAFGVSNSVANCTGFLVPLVVGVLTDKNQTVAAWQKVFYISEAIFVSGSVMALGFLRTDPVSWAKDPDEDKLPQPARDSRVYNRRLTSAVEDTA
ncbi:sialin-like [Branchiostoma floridae]|uniref:Sialin-like n=1 Tax=Branchiostoma floridae TaxID=7739 RepID=A0A9J7HPB7_BRAFL|nr:sialin-like [Branchiostoma floridae]